MFWSWKITLVEFEYLDQAGYLLLILLVIVALRGNVAEFVVSGKSHPGMLRVT